MFDKHGRMKLTRDHTVHHIEFDEDADGHNHAHVDAKPFDLTKANSLGGPVEPKEKKKKDKPDCECCFCQKSNPDSQNLIALSEKQPSDPYDVKLDT